MSLGNLLAIVRQPPPRGEPKAAALLSPPLAFERIGLSGCNRQVQGRNQTLGGRKEKTKPSRAYQTNQTLGGTLFAKPSSLSYDASKGSRFGNNCEPGRAAKIVLLFDASVCGIMPNSKCRSGPVFEWVHNRTEAVMEHTLARKGYDAEALHPLM